MAAALSSSQTLQQLKERARTRTRTRTSPRNAVVLSCQRPKQVERAKKEMKEEKKASLGFFVGFEKLGKRVKENLSPQRKGDWKDLTLMSLSFAVYVYISQKLVCAYFAFMYMPR
ncbi:hypothetical protein UlMin_007310 [Ulmus minor]